MIDLSNYSYRNILNAMLSRVPDSYDKRDTSPIQTALGPAAYALAEFYLVLNQIQNSAYVQTAVGSDLDELGLIGNVTRYPASPAVRLGTFNVEVPLGSRYSTINGDDSINFVATSYIGPDGDNYTYQLTAETPGVIGNDYIGPILPIDVIPNLTLAEIADIMVLGDDEEDDEEMRARLIEALTAKPFAGNIVAYKQFAMGIDGVGGVQVYPTPNGGGTVGLSIVGTDFLPASPTVVDAVQTAIDPEVNQGIGLGYAPIGAHVTVKAPNSVTVDIAAKLTLATGTVIGQVEGPIREALEAYFGTVRDEWDTNVSSTSVQYVADIYIAKIITAILSVEGVINATNVTLNGSASDLSLTQTFADNNVPVVGTVTLT